MLDLRTGEGSASIPERFGTRSTVIWHFPVASMFHFEFVRAGDARHLNDWRALHVRGPALGAAHSPYPVFPFRRPDDLWCRVLDGRAALVTGSVISLARSRKLPLIRIGRLHFGTSLVATLGSKGLPSFLEALSRLSGGPSVLSAHVYATSDVERKHAETLLTGAGFEPDPVPRTFHETLLVPVGGTADDRLQRLSYAARRGIRQVAERGYRIAPIEDEKLAERVAWLKAEAHRRTGDTPGGIDFRAIIAGARQDAESSRLLGVFHPERPEATALVGFAHALSTGRSIVYASAGTERAADIGSTPLSYGLVARLLDWTAERGYDLFDFGGITPADAPDHPLAGISEFKRKFRGHDAQVASNFRIDLRPAHAAVLRALELPARLVGRR